MITEKYKPIDGKMEQLPLWQSDQLIVVKKQGNACGAKGDDCKYATVEM